jgi:PAS domain S-box-containing protein
MSREQRETKRAGRWLAAAVVAVGALALAAAVASYVETQRSHILRETSQTLKAFVDLKAQQIAAWRHDQIAEAEFLRGNRQLREIFSRVLAGDEDARQELADWIGPTRRANPSWVFAAVLDAAMRTRQRFGLLGEPELGAFARDVVGRAVGRQVVVLSDLHRRTLAEPLHLDLVVPIADEHGRALGLIYVRIDPEIDLLPLLRSLPIPGGSTELLLVRREGDGLVGVSGRPRLAGSLVEFRMPLAGAAGPEGAAARDVTGAVSGADYRGVPVVAALAPVPDSPWRLVAKLDLAEVEASLRKLRTVAGAVAFLLALAGAGIIGAFRERRRRIEASARLERERERAVASARYQALMRGAYDGILLADERLRIIDANLRISELTGYTREELLGLEGHALRVPEARAGLDQDLERARRSDGATFETVYLRKDGCRVPVEVSVRFLVENGQPLVLAHVRDISARRRAEEQARDLNAELERRVAARTEALERANRELEAFSYSISHDLRAPLRAIEGFSRILVDEHAASFDGQIPRLLGVINANARRMAQLIDDLLAFLRFGRTELRRGAVDMRALVLEVCDELCPEPARGRVRIDVGALPACRADAALIRQVWANLIGNALKFTSRREQSRIAVKGRRCRGGVVYTVRDNWVGFDMQYADKLFGVFQRLHGPDQFEGTGVGLAIVQRIVGRHGGRVWGHGRPDGGALFGFVLSDGGADA